MEVASPLTISHNSSRTKRHLPLSPGFVESNSRSSFPMGLESSEEFLQQRSFKRRRFNGDVSMEGDSENNVNQSTFGSHSPQKSLFSSSPNGFKRCRSEAYTPQNELQRVVEAQTSQIQSLHQEKSTLESSLNLLKAEHDKVSNENKILKRAVAIQQERQTQAASEIEAARQYKFGAEDKIKRLEQMILSLRYHLQAQQTNPGNDFMGFPPRPPDVY